MSEGTSSDVLARMINQMLYDTNSSMIYCSVVFACYKMPTSFLLNLNYFNVKMASVSHLI